MSESDAPTPKRKWYPQKFRAQWLNDPKLKDWLREDETEKGLCLCIWCGITLRGVNKSTLFKHRKTVKHQKWASISKPNSRSKSSIIIQRKACSKIFQSTAIADGGEVSKAEATIAAIISEHHIPVAQCDLLLEACKKAFHDSDIAKRINLKEIAKRSNESAFVTALNLSENRQAAFRISSGSQELNTLLRGGVESMAITEVFGEAGTGKSQLAHTLCVTAQIPNEAYGGGKVMFIDADNTFSLQHIRAIAIRFQLEESEVLENIVFARAYSSDHQLYILDSAEAKIRQEKVFKLLIIDSMALFKIEYSKGDLYDKQQRNLEKYMAKLQKISEECNVSVFITNQVNSVKDLNPKDDFNFGRPEGSVSEPSFPIITVGGQKTKTNMGGHIFARASKTRILLRIGVGAMRIAKLYDNPELNDGETSFAVTNGGIDDSGDMHYVDVKNNRETRPIEERRSE